MRNIDEYELQLVEVEKEPEKTIKQVLIENIEIYRDLSEKIDQVIVKINDKRGSS